MKVKCNHCGLESKLNIFLADSIFRKVDDKIYCYECLRKIVLTFIDEVRTMGRQSYSAINLLGVEGKRVSIIPTTKGMNLTELYSKKEGLNGYMGAILYDKRWKKYVLVDLDKDFQMSRDCLNEAFDMVEEYWKKHEVKPSSSQD